MRLLILGGTVFLGRQLVEEGIGRGHDVSIFHRGHHGADLFADRPVTRLVGDRNGDLAALGGSTTWDAVIDCSGQLPRHVRATADALAGRVGHSTFVSSISVYADASKPGLDESAPLEQLPDPDVEGMEHYGGLKAASEAALLDRAGTGGAGAVRCVRPGLIVGPFDPSGRFTWWPVRAARGGPMLVPGRPDRAVQVIDARDLAWFLLDGAEAGADGVVHVSGPAEGTLTMGAVITACVDAAVAAGRDPADPVWVRDEAALVEAGAGPWMELPLWLPEDSEAGGLMEVDLSRARAQGLRTRPISEIAADTLAWATEAGDGAIPAGSGIDPVKEAALLDQLA